MFSYCVGAPTGAGFRLRHFCWAALVGWPPGRGGGLPPGKTDPKTKENHICFRFRSKKTKIGF